MQLHPTSERCMEAALCPTFAPSICCRPFFRFAAAVSSRWPLRVALAGTLAAAVILDFSSATDLFRYVFIALTMMETGIWRGRNDLIVWSATMDPACQSLLHRLVHSHREQSAAIPARSPFLET